MSTERQESKLIRNIGFWPLMVIAYGQIIGAGIMTQTGIAIGMTGTGVVLAYIISAVCTTFQNFPTAILGATVPVSGGEYRYISRLRGKKWGFVYLATYVVSKLTIALYALSCASYLVAFLTGISEQIIAICLLVAAFAINLLGTKQSAFVTTGITLPVLWSSQDGYCLCIRSFQPDGPWPRQPALRHRAALLCHRRRSGYRQYGK